LPNERAVIRIGQREPITVAEEKRFKLVPIELDHHFDQLAKQ
jgi:hypothetical protein